ncbi:MAG: hypothetical protein ACXWEY_05500, partial [Bacteroidia bacterium]
LITVAWLQGIYYFVTGIWPLIQMESFVWLTGPKTDYWLVRMVALLIVSISLALLSAAYHKRVSPEIKILAVASIISFCIIDFYYAWVDSISGIYVLDGIAEIGFLLSWIFAQYRSVRKHAYL